MVTRLVTPVGRVVAGFRVSPPAVPRCTAAQPFNPALAGGLHCVNTTVLYCTAGWSRPEKLSVNSELCQVSVLLVCGKKPSRPARRDSLNLGSPHRRPRLVLRHHRPSHANIDIQCQCRELVRLSRLSVTPDCHSAMTSIQTAVQVDSMTACQVRHPLYSVVSTYWIESYTGSQQPRAAGPAQAVW